MAQKRIPWEVLAALALNLILLALFFIVKTAAPSPPPPPEISLDISDFKPPEPKTVPPVEIRTGLEGGGPDTRELAKSAMREVSPEPPAGGSVLKQTESERRSELARIEQGIRNFDGIANVRSGLSGGALPAGLETGASFRERGDAENRSRRLRRFGGSRETEDAVEKALDYLAAAQNKNGSWGSAESFKTGDAAALTSLALLSFFAHGENFQSKKYSKVIHKGSDFLIELANHPDIEYAGSSFGHAILTYALAEGYAVSGSMSLRNALEKRVRSILNRQNKFGSFAPNYDNSPQAPPQETKKDDPLFREIIIGESACDLSLLGWHIQALTAARNAGIRLDGLDKTLELAAEALIKIHQAEKGGFSQGINMGRFPAADNMNPVGLLGLQLLNAGGSNPARRAERILQEIRPPQWKAGGKFPLYRWYYHTQALFQAEKGRGKRWEEWNEALKKELLAARRPDGSWQLPGGDGSFKVRNSADLSIYGTTLCCLMLQVYYRYLPGYSIAESTSFSDRADAFDQGMAGRISRLPGGADPMAALILGIGSVKFEPIRFGKFDGRPADSAAPHADDEFPVHSSMRSTVAVRSTADWPQLLQPNQRIALFLDDLIPRNFRGHLRLTLGTVGKPADAQELKLSLEATMNGKRLYNSYLMREKMLVEFTVPSGIFLPFGNILQIRNNGKAPLAFDAAVIDTVTESGRPLYLLAENPEELPPSMRACFSANRPPQESVSCRLSGQTEERQLLAAIPFYDSGSCYIAHYPLSGSEYMGDEFQLHYLRQTAREIVDWIAGGGSGVQLQAIRRGGRIYDSVFGTEYPAAASLRRVARLFEGNPKKLPAQFYPKYGEKPMLFGNVAAAANAPGVATLVITRRFAMPEESEVIALVPWNGPTDMTVEKGVLPAGSPFAGIAPEISAESSSIQIENNLFRLSGVFPEITVIRLVRREADEPRLPPPSGRDVYPEIEFDQSAIRTSLPATPKPLAFKPLRAAGGFVSHFGRNASFSRSPATAATESGAAFKPVEKQSIIAAFRANAAVPRRYDSVYLPLGGMASKAKYLSFNVYARVTEKKKRDTAGRVPFRFVLSGRCYGTTVPVGRYRRIVLPLDGLNVGWSALRILEPRRLLDDNLQTVSYEINDIGVWCE